MVARALLRNSIFFEEWLAPTTTFVKYRTLKKLFPAINYKEKMFLGATIYFGSQSFLMSLYLLFHYDFTTVQQYVISAFII